MHPPPWADLATTRDLGAVEARIAAAEENLRLRLEALEDRIRAEFGDRLTQHTRTLWVAMVGQSGVMAAGIFGAAALFA